MTAARRAAAAEVALAFGLAAVALWATDRLAMAFGAVAAVAGLASALAFVGAPLIALGWGVRKGLPALADPLGIDRAPIGRGLFLGLAVSLLVLPLFAVGLDLWETRVLGHHRGDISALRSAGVAFQGRNAPTVGHVALLEDRRGLAIENHTGAAVVVRPTCAAAPECAPRTVAVGGRTLLPAAAAESFAVLAADLAPLPAETLLGAGTGERLENPIHAGPGLGWLLQWLLTQLLVVALPEEIFFRGYVQQRLRAFWPPRRTLFGTAFGGAHVVTALLFALIHLVILPAPERLLVFFPGLIFGWLAERSRGVFASTAHHALANVVQTGLLLVYGAG